MGNLENAKAALDAVSVELTSLRDSQKAKLARISEIDKQIKALRDAPISLEDFHGYVAKHIESLGRVYGRQLQLRELVRPNRGGHGTDFHVPSYQRPWTRFEEEGDVPIHFHDRSTRWRGNNDPFSMLCFFVPEVVTKRLLDQLRMDAGPQWVAPDAPPVEARRALIVQLEEERDATEDELEDVTRSIAAITATLGV